MNRALSDYKDFGITDFLADDFFIASMRRPGDSTAEFWDAYCSVYPGQRETFEKARHLVLFMKVQPHFPEQEQVNRVWDSIARRRRSQRTVKILKLWSVGAAAACLLVLLLLSGLFRQPPVKTYLLVQAGAGKITSHLLPDGSTALLTAHSSISYDSSDFTRHRVLQSNGEVYFEVQHSHRGTPFTVLAGREKIEVLGTAFLINNRSDTITVALSNGRVRFHYGQNGHIDLLPQDVYAYAPGGAKPVKLTLTADALTQWKEREWAFNSTPLKEIMDILHTYYGYKIAVEDTALLQHRYNGHAATSDISGLIEKLRLIYDLNITTKNDSLILKAGKQF
ncbi:FecR family protein [Chitinophaga sp. 212800010-3]|uniref:FecR family protein n=1 Tax=unclassified Chitinophaga TaxID=2619133 RepID=UPI002DF36ABF|nr:hypothetical protein [Chitinophaga sp. 212800010-3]